MVKYKLLVIKTSGFPGEGIQEKKFSVQPGKNVFMRIIKQTNFP